MAPGSLVFAHAPRVLAAGCVGGPKEAAGPLAEGFDELVSDSRCGQSSWELAESALAERALHAALVKGRLQPEDLDVLLGGDLQNQCTATAYLMRGVNTPFLGLYNACATMAQGLALGAALVNGGQVRRAAALASSHFCAAERQFRTPLGYGGKRTPTAQWTVTGAGCVVLCAPPSLPAGPQPAPAEGRQGEGQPGERPQGAGRQGEAQPGALCEDSRFAPAPPAASPGQRPENAAPGPGQPKSALGEVQSGGAQVQAACLGRVVDAGVTDITNMGAAMAPAAWDTISRHLRATNRTPADFDAIFTGDLGLVGSRLLSQLARLDGAALDNHRDCGLLIYERTAQNVGAGASGAGCSACVLCAHILPALAAGQMRRVLFVSTGALMSQLTAQQGQSIPAVAHLVELAAPGERGIVL